MGDREGRAYPMEERCLLGEPVLEYNMGWTRRGVPFWKDNGCYPLRKVQFPMDTKELIVGQSAVEVALSFLQKNNY